jgi:hypothetical protein
MRNLNKTYLPSLWWAHDNLILFAYIFICFLKEFCINYSFVIFINQMNLVTQWIYNNNRSINEKIIIFILLSNV